MKRKKKKAPLELFVDSFCGGGGATEGIEGGINRSIDIAINHDKDAIATHVANHPNVKHYCEDVFEVDPIKATGGTPVALAWFSPDCKHFSKAKGATPVSKNIRGLAWVAIRWAARVKPRVIMLENVMEFTTWGQLRAIRDPETGRVKTTDIVRAYDEKKKEWKNVNRVASPGEVVPKEKQLEEPDPKKKGLIFKEFIRTLKILGYDVEYRILKACDYGTPTTRKRLFLIARSDGQPIVWPEATHAPRDSQEVQEGNRLPYRAAKEVIDFSLESKSIFNRDKPLKESTMKRIARGLKKFVVENNDPFLTKGKKSDQFCAGIQSFIQMGYGDPEGKRILDLDNPFGTITSGGNKFGLATAWIKEDYGQSIGTDINNPLGTITAKSNHHSLMTVFLSKHYGGNYKGAGIDLRDPMDTITQVDHHSLVSAKLRKIATQVKSDKELIRVGHIISALFYSSTRLFRLKCIGRLNGNVGNSLQVEEFMRKHCISGMINEEKSSFLIKYYGSDVGQSVDIPLHTIPTRDRFGLIQIHGMNYQIVDITLRMIQPHELALAQGVSESYILDKDANGKTISKQKQVARIGNMVVPQIPEALVKANLPEHCPDGPFVEQVELLNRDFESEIAA